MKLGFRGSGLGEGFWGWYLYGERGVGVDIVKLGGDERGQRFLCGHCHLLGGSTEKREKSGRGFLLILFRGRAEFGEFLERHTSLPNELSFHSEPTLSCHVHPFL